MQAVSLRSAISTVNTTELPLAVQSVGLSTSASMVSSVTQQEFRKQQSTLNFLSFLERNGFTDATSRGQAQVSNEQTSARAQRRRARRNASIKSSTNKPSSAKSKVNDRTTKGGDAQRVDTQRKQTTKSENIISTTGATANMVSRSDTTTKLPDGLKMQPTTMIGSFFIGLIGTAIAALMIRTKCFQKIWTRTQNQEDIEANHENESLLEQEPPQTAHHLGAEQASPSQDSNFLRGGGI